MGDSEGLALSFHFSMVIDLVNRPVQWSNKRQILNDQPIDRIELLTN